MGRRDQAHIDPPGLGAADPLKAAVLNHSQQLDLRRQGNVADFVEEQSALIGQLKAPLARGYGPGVGPLLVAEKLVFDQAFRQGAAVDFDEGVFPPAALLVDGLCHLALARAGLAGDQNAGPRLSHLFDLAVNALPRR